MAWFQKHSCFHCLSLNLIQVFKSRSINKDKPCRKVCSQFAKQSYLILLVLRMEFPIFPFQFVRPPTLYCPYITLVSYSQKLLILHTRVSLHSFDVTLQELPCCTKVDVLLYKICGCFRFQDKSLALQTTSVSQDADFESCVYMYNHVCIFSQSYQLKAFV